MEAHERERLQAIQHQQKRYEVEKYKRLQRRTSIVVAEQRTRALVTILISVMVNRVAQSISGFFRQLKSENWNTFVF